MHRMQQHAGHGPSAVNLGAGLLLLTALLVATLACVSHPMKVETLQGGTLATMREVEDIQSLHSPQLLTVDKAADLMREDEEVLGFQVGERAVAIALRVLDDHEIVNLARDESTPAIAATW